MYNYFLPLTNYEVPILLCSKHAVLFWNVCKALKKYSKQKYSKLMSFVVLAKRQLRESHILFSIFNCLLFVKIDNVTYVINGLNCKRALFLFITHIIQRVYCERLEVVAASAGLINLGTKGNMKRAERLNQGKSLRNSSGISSDEKKVCTQTQQKVKPKRKRNSCPLSYIEVIAYAILSSPRKRITLSEIYSFIQDSYPEFTENRVRWKNTVRHNLSLHECFQRGEIAYDRTGCYWRIHPSFVADFSRGDFSRRKSLQALPFALDGGYSSLENPFPAPGPAFPYHTCEPPTSPAFLPHVGMFQFYRHAHAPYGQHNYFPWDHCMY